MSSFSSFSERAARESRAEISALLSMRDSAPRRHWSDDSDDDAKRPASSQRRRQLSNRRPDSPDRSVYASDQAVVSQRKHKELQHALKASSEKMAALEADLAESRRHASQQLQQLYLADSLI
jgi:predicted  nucleic acid-binding Zn-ribbon protein